MRGIRIVLLLIIILLGLGCYPEVTGFVVDAETGQPIEGAVVLVEWTITTGVPGMTGTKSYKVAEMISDKDGKVILPEGGPNLLVNPPRVTVYKKDYVAWNNEHIFPDYRERKDFKWSEATVFKLERFKKEYSRADHVFFLHSITHWGKLINESYRWEELEKELKR